MHRNENRAFRLLAVAAMALATPAVAQDTEAPRDWAPLSNAMRDAPEDVREFHEHMIILASPWMEGRLPGTRGAELAREYVETQFKVRGLTPPVPGEEDGTFTYRQRFPLGSDSVMRDRRLAVGDLEFEVGSDYEMTRLGSDADVSAPLSFVGYGIDEGPEGYSNFSEDDDLSGRIAVVFRFEPMDENGQSQWKETGWSSKINLEPKFRKISQLNPAGVILVNPPGADDPRAKKLFTAGKQYLEEVPLFMMTPDAAGRLMQATGDPRTIEEWRALADSDQIGITHLSDTPVTMTGTSEVEVSLWGENIMARVEGRGDIGDEYVVIGAHMDHLGMGDFGSNEGPGKLHPGADDNASGVAALIMLAESLQTAYDEAPEDMPLRDVILIAFDGEESGLNGSRYYVDNPVQPLEDLALMINFDMIGRIEGDRRLSISGIGTGDGMADWARGVFETSDLEIVESERSSGGSDHTNFYRRQIPILFAITPFPLHNDYHTSRDTVDLINFEGGADTVELFHDLTFGAASMPEKFEFQSGRRREAAPTQTRRRGSMPRVKFGFRTATDDGEPGLRIVFVRDESAAEDADIQVNDRLLKWNDVELDSRPKLIEQLRSHDPGDVVQIVLLRDGEERTVEMELQPRD
ncbi:MAG: M28 family peptidase [Planctomycetota bacterium]|nr:M28 family peptidase [Planctomycetota bacterium]